jgi:GT2 family glycosyltransferase
MLLDAGLLRRGLRFDEDYFLYMEDLDLCCRVRDLGRTLRVSRRAAARHVGGAALAEAKDPFLGMGPTGLREQARSKAVFARKWLSPPRRLVFLAVAFLAKPLAGVVRTRSTRFLRPYLQGLRRGLRARLSVQVNRK